MSKIEEYLAQMSFHLRRAKHYLNLVRIERKKLREETEFASSRAASDKKPKN